MELNPFLIEDKDLFTLPIFCLLLRLCSANHRAGYFSKLACDWLSILWAYFKQETENGPWLQKDPGHQQYSCWPSFFLEYSSPTNNGSKNFHLNVQDSRTVFIHQGSKLSTKSISFGSAIVTQWADPILPTIGIYAGIILTTAQACWKYNNGLFYFHKSLYKHLIKHAITSVGLGLGVLNWFLSFMIFF